MWTATPDVYFKGTTGICHDWDCHYISSLSLWWVEGDLSGSTAAKAARPRSPISSPAAWSLGDPSQASWELISICYKWESWHFPPVGPRHRLTNLNCTAAPCPPLDVWGQGLFSEFSSFGFYKRKHIWEEACVGIREPSRKVPLTSYHNIQGFQWLHTN